MKKEYTKLSKYYDVLHHEKDYNAESNFFMKLIKEYKISKGNRLLDTACGTGSHILYFKSFFECEGLDLNKEMLEIARKKNKSIKFYCANMVDFHIPQKYDVIVNLFNSTMYLDTRTDLEKTLKNFNKYLVKGGILLLETRFIKGELKEVNNHIRKFKSNKFDIFRTINLSIKDDIATLDINYKINSKEITETDKLKVNLYSKEEFAIMFKKCGFKIKILQYKSNDSTIFMGIKE